MINFRNLQKSLKCMYVNASVKNQETGEYEKIRIVLEIDRGGRIINCTRIGRLFDRIYGRQLLSVANGVNNAIMAEVEDEVDRINGKYFIPIG